MASSVPEASKSIAMTGAICPYTQNSKVVTSEEESQVADKPSMIVCTAKSSCRTASVKGTATQSLTTPHPYLQRKKSHDPPPIMNIIKYLLGITTLTSSIECSTLPELYDKILTAFSQAVNSRQPS